jgi:hypothetical protein
MNDSSELSYAAELIESEVGEVTARPKYGKIAELVPQSSYFANPFEFGVRPFIACFCREQDLLSQWRGYGGGQAAYSLGLGLEVLAKMGTLPPKTFLRQVVYQEAEQRGLVREMIESWLRASLELLDAQDLDPADFPYPAVVPLRQSLVEYYLCFKHPTFSEELEWRLIKLVDVREEMQLLRIRRADQVLDAAAERLREVGIPPPPSSSWTVTNNANTEGIDMKFRPSALGLVPYVELPLRDRAGIFADRLPLWQVRQGPVGNPQLALESLEMFLDSKGFRPHTEVFHSGIPLRPH